MTAAGLGAGPGQPGRPAGAGHGAPDTGQPGLDAVAAQPGQPTPRQPASEQPAAEQPGPAQSAAEQPAAVQPAAEQSAAGPAVPGPPRPEQSREDTDIGWGDYPGRDDVDRLYRDRPPHWADY